MADSRELMKRKPFVHKRILVASCITITLCSSLVSIFGFTLWKEMRDVNVNTATQVSQGFIENISQGNMELAYSILSEKFSPRITKDQFLELIDQDKTIFNAYEKLDICEWGVFIDDGLITHLTQPNVLG